MIRLDILVREKERERENKEGKRGGRVKPKTKHVEHPRQITRWAKEK